MNLDAGVGILVSGTVDYTVSGVWCLVSGVISTAKPNPSISMSRLYQIPNYKTLTYKVLHVLRCTQLYITNNGRC